MIMWRCCRPPHCSEVRASRGPVKRSDTLRPAAASLPAEKPAVPQRFPVTPARALSKSSFREARTSQGIQAVCASPALRSRRFFESDLSDGIVIALFPVGEGRDQSSERDVRVEKTEQTLLIEVGGTTTRLASLDGTEILRFGTPNHLRATAGSPLHADPDLLLGELIERIRTNARTLLEGAEPDTVVVAYPGPVDASGIVTRVPTIFGPHRTESFNLRDRLQRLWSTARVHVLNDLTCAGFYFAQRGHRDFCVASVGSGIANRVFLDGRPQGGQRGRGGEIGRLKLAPQPHTVVADIHRDLGDLASGRGTAWLAQFWAGRQPQALSDSTLATEVASLWSDTNGGEPLVRAFRADDKLARRIVEAAAYPLAVALGSIHLGLGIDRFFVVGGFAKSLGEPYRELLTHLMRGVIRGGGPWESMIELGPEGVEEGLMGAATFAKNELERSSVAHLHLIAS